MKGKRFTPGDLVVFTGAMWSGERAQAHAKDKPLVGLVLRMIDNNSYEVVWSNSHTGILNTTLFDLYDVDGQHGAL